MKILRFLLFVQLILFSMSMAQGENIYPRKTEEYYAKKKAQYQKIKDSSLELLESSPADSQIILKLAKIYKDEKNKDSAVLFYDSLLKLYPDNFTACEELEGSVGYSRKNRPDSLDSVKAAEFYTKACTSLVIMDSTAFELIATIECRDGYIRYPQDEALLLIILYDGSFQVYDTLGELVYDIDPELNIPKFKSYFENREPGIVEMDGHPDQIRLIPNTDYYAILKTNVHYSYSHNDIINFVNRLLNYIKWAFGIGSVVEIRSLKSNELICKYKHIGWCNEVIVDPSKGLAIFLTDYDLRQKLVIENIRSQDILYEEELPSSIPSLTIYNDTLYAFGGTIIHVYPLDSGDIIRKVKAHYLPVEFRYFNIYKRLTDQGELFYVLNRVVDTTVGPITFMKDRILYDFCFSNRARSLPPDSDWTPFYCELIDSGEMIIDKADTIIIAGIRNQVWDKYYCGDSTSGFYFPSFQPFMRNKFLRHLPGNKIQIYKWNR